MKTLVCLATVLSLPLGDDRQSASQDRAAMTARCFAALSDATVEACTAVIVTLPKDAPELPRALYQRGMANRAKKQLDAAIADFNRILEILPDNLPALTARGITRRDQGDREGALADFNKTAELAPNNATPYVNRGWTKWMMGDRTALADLTKAVEIAPTPQHLTMRGRVRASTDPAGARADFDKALEQDPRYPPALTERADLETSTDQVDAAKADYDKALEIDPTFGNAYIGRANLLWNNGDPAGVYSDYNRVVELVSLSQTHRMERAAAAGAVGRADVAMADFNFLIERDPRFADAYHFRGILKSDRHDFEGALQDFKAHNELFDGHPYVWLRLFLVEARIGDRVKAAETLRTAIDRLRADHAADWPLKIGDHLLGRLDAGALLLAALSREERITKEHQCEMFFYVGWLKLLNHDEGGAKDAFEKSVATNAYHMVEMQSAKAELTFLSGK